MKIIDINAEKINACFVFDAGNCEISVSTIFNKNKPEIAVFDKCSGDLLQDKFSCVRSALSWVSSFGPRD